MPPENVRLRFADGTVRPVDCVYRGLEDGIHVWDVVNAVGPPGPFEILIDLLPGHTAIELPTEGRDRR